MKQITASKILKVSPICPNNFTMLSSATGSHKAEARLYIIVRAANLIIGIAHMPTIIIIPINPNAFFSNAAHPITESVASLNAFPTIGIALEATAFIALEVNPSTLLVKVPSKDRTLTNIVITIPKLHIIPDFRNLLNLLICILFDIFETIPNIVVTKTIGSITIVTKLLINTTQKSIIGWIVPSRCYVSSC